MNKFITYLLLAALLATAMGFRIRQDEAEGKKPEKDPQDKGRFSRPSTMYKWIFLSFSITVITELLL